MLKNDQRREEKMLELEAMDVGIEVAPSVGVRGEIDTGEADNDI